MSSVAGKVVLITGSAGGIGTPIVERFAREQAYLALIDINASALEAQATQLRRKGIRVEMAVADLSTFEGVRGGIDAVLAPYDQQISVLVSNVGALLYSKLFLDLSIEQWEQTFNINFWTHVYACYCVAPRMRSHGGGHIVLMGSDQGIQLDATLGPYAVAKSGVHGLAILLAQELPAHGIYVNAVAPGMTDTPLVQNLITERMREWSVDRETATTREIQNRRIPLNRFLTPEEVADAVFFLATNDASNGTILNLSGGYAR